MGINEYFLTTSELQQRWHVSESTLYRMRKRGDLTEVDLEQKKPGPGRRLVRFSLKDILQWENEHRKACNGQQAQRAQ